MAPGCTQASIDAEIAKRFEHAKADELDGEAHSRFVHEMSKHGNHLNWLKTVSDQLGKQGQKSVCDPACQKRRRVAAAKATWVKAKSHAEKAPGRAARAEENYLLLARGEPGYLKVLEERYRKHATTWATGAMEQHMGAMTDMAFMLEDYTTTYGTLPRLRELAVLRDKEETALRSAVVQREGGARAGDRRVVYELREMDALSTFRTVAIVLFYLLLVAWLLFSNFFRDQLYKVWFVWVGIAVYAGWPWLTGPISKWLVGGAAWVGYQWSQRPYRNVALSV